MKWPPFYPKTPNKWAMAYGLYTNGQYHPKNQKKNWRAMLHHTSTHTNQHNHSTRRLFTKKRKPQKHGKETHSSLLPNKINTIHTMNWHTHLIISTVGYTYPLPPPTQRWLIASDMDWRNNKLTSQKSQLNAPNIVIKTQYGKHVKPTPRK